MRCNQVLMAIPFNTAPPRPAATAFPGARARGLERARWRGPGVPFSWGSGHARVHIDAPGGRGRRASPPPGSSSSLPWAFSRPAQVGPRRGTGRRPSGAWTRCSPPLQQAGGALCGRAGRASPGRGPHTRRRQQCPRRRLAVHARLAPTPVRRPSSPGKCHNPGPEDDRPGAPCGCTCASYSRSPARGTSRSQARGGRAGVGV